MNVSAKQIVRAIEEKISSLKKGMTEEDVDAVKESAAAIEAYCQLLKDVPSEKNVVKQSVEERGSIPLKQPVIQEYREDKSEGNLLDF